MDNFSLPNNFISAADLFVRWCGCDEEDILKLIESKELISYQLLVSEDIEARLIEGTTPLHFRGCGFHMIYDWDSFHFDLRNVEEVENKHRNFLILKSSSAVWSTTRVDTIAPQYIVNPKEWFQAENVRKELQLAPISLCDLLNAAVFLTDMEAERREYKLLADSCSYRVRKDFFAEECLRYISIHFSKYAEYCGIHNIKSELLNSISYYEKDHSRKDQPSNEIDIIRLNLELKKLKEKLNKSSNPKAIDIISYSSRTILAVVEQWNKLSDSSPIKKYGFTEAELTNLAPKNTPRSAIRAIKAELNNSAIKIWASRGARPS